MGSFRHLPVLFAVLAGVPPGTSELVIVTDEAETAIHILERREAGRPVAEESWRALFATEGYRRLQAREAAMGRSFEDSAFRAFLLSDSLLRRSASLRKTLAAWRSADLGGAGARALAYLPPGTPLRARVYLLIKPLGNSFVFEPETDPAIMLYLDPERSRDQLENTIAHELHHIGYATACRSRGPATVDSALAEARGWLSAFGEGVAMLAAAGGPQVHPHAASPPEDRLRWDRNVANAPADLRRLERFFLDILDRRLTDPDSTRRVAMSFFGVQGPWYTVGWLMASAIERVEGRPALVETLCDPLRLLRRYNAAARKQRPGYPAAPLWSARLLARLGGSSQRRNIGR
jgi:hypothetical protein